MALVNRDPFARQELHRRTVEPVGKQTCSWCGNRNAHGNLFEYRVVSDGGRVFVLNGHFCEVGCMRSYHD